MILHRLVVERFACLNPGATIAEFHPQLTLIHGPNEAGKSTLLRALEFALFQRHRVGGEKVEPLLLPRGTRVAPSVEVEFTHADPAAGADGPGAPVRWRVRKRFLQRQMAELARWRDGAFEVVAENDAADDRLRELLQFAYAGRGVGAADLRGIAEVLLVPQGELRLAGTLGNPAREQLLPLMAGTATTAATHELLERVRRHAAQLLTERRGTPRTGSPLAEAQRLLAELVQPLEDARRNADEVALLQQSLAPDDGREAELAARRSSLQEALSAAEAEQRRAAKLAGDAELLQQRAGASATAATAARQRVEEVAKRRREAEEAARKAAEAALGERDRQRELELAEQSATLARQQADAAVARHDLAAEAQRRCDEAREFVTAREEAAELARRFGDDERLAAQLADDERELLARPRPTARELRRLRELHDKQADLGRRLAALELRVTFTAARAVTLVRSPSVEGAAPTAGATDAAPEPLSAGERRELRGRDPLEFELQGIGRLAVHGPDLPQRTELAREHADVAAEFAQQARPFGTTDLVALEALVEERREIEARCGKRQAARSALFADAAVRQAAAEKRRRHETTVATLGAARPEFAESLPDAAALAREAAAAAEPVRRAKEDLRRLGLAADQALAGRDSARTQAAAAQRAAQVAAEAARAARRELDDALAGEPDDAVRIAAATQAAATARAMAAELATLAQEREQLGDTGVRLEACTGALAEFDRAREEEQRDRERRKTRLELLCERGHWQRRAELEERLAVLETARDRAKLDHEATVLLLDTLDEAQRTQVATLVAPLAEKVRRMLAPVVEQSVAIGFDDQLLPLDLARGGGEPIALSHLSAGTQDQVALVTRIALGELWSERHGRHALLLDDPLVNCDPGRRRRLLEILVRAATKLQLVVFTCDRDGFAAYAGDKRLVALADARVASAGSAVTG